MRDLISAVILCGGKSRRMGRNKAELLLDGETFIERIRKGLSAGSKDAAVLVDEVLLSVADKADEPDRDIRKVADIYKGCGPLAGLHAALGACRNEILFSVTCDMPFADAKIAQELYPYLKEEVDAVIPVSGDGKKHVLCGLYRKRVLPVLEQHLAEGRYRVREIMEELKVCYVDAEKLTDGEQKLQNINTPEEYESLGKARKNQIPVISLVAYSGTGKTTFMVKLIPELKKRGLRVAVVKHDAHDFEIDKEGKDSFRITQAGADVTGLISDKKAVLMENRQVEPEFLFSHIENVDVILTEGYKHKNWPKIMLYREAVGKPLPAEPEECLAVVSDVQIEGAEKIYNLEDAAGVAELIIRQIEGLKERER